MRPYTVTGEAKFSAIRTEPCRKGLVTVSHRVKKALGMGLAISHFGVGSHNELACSVQCSRLKC
jgi:hypothetical protein